MLISYDLCHRMMHPKVEPDVGFPKVENRNSVKV